MQITSQSVGTNVPFQLGSLNVGPFTVSGSISPVVSQAVLVAGQNAFSVPVGSVGVVIVPPVTNGVALRYKGFIGSGGTVTITVGSTIVTGVSVGTAGSGYPASTTFLATPTQSGGSGCFFLVTTSSSGVPSLTFISGQGGTGYVAATIPWTPADFGINIPPAAPWWVPFDSGNLPSTIYINAAAATAGYTEVLFF